MRCVMCHRQLNASAVPGLAIGPKCAKDRGLMLTPTRRRPVRLFSNLTHTTPDPAQMDWVNQLSGHERPKTGEAMSVLTEPIIPDTIACMSLAETEQLVDRLRRQFTTLPRLGTPVAEMTDRDKLAIAFHHGVPCEFDWSGNVVTMRSTVPFGIADRGDGGYIVAVAPHLKGRA